MATYKKNPHEYKSPKKAQKALAQQEMTTLQESPGDFGLSQSEKESGIALARQRATAEAQAQQAAMGQMALGGTGVQQGALVKGAQAAAGAGGQAAAGASHQQTMASRALIEQARSRIMQTYENMAARQHQREEWAAEFTADVAKTAAGAVAGGAAGAAGAGGAGQAAIGAMANTADPTGQAATSIIEMMRA